VFETKLLQQRQIKRIIPVKELVGGLTNQLFLCEDGETGKKVVYRVYGMIQDDPYERMVELSICTLLGANKIGPNILGIVPNGRLEEFIPGKSLSTKDLSLPQISRFIATNVAQFHKLTMPIDKTPVIARRIMNVQSMCIQNGINLDKYEDDIDEVLDFLNKTDCPVVFCHNDVHEGNCLFDKTRRGKKLPSDMRLIDFEYASYNFRSFDHANHFGEWMFNYENDQAPYYTYNPTNWPTDNQILFYLKHYCKEMEIPLDKTQMLLEIKQFALVSHIYWFLWSLVQEKVSVIRFDYKSYAYDRLQAYRELKARIQNEVEKNSR